MPNLEETLGIELEEVSGTCVKAVMQVAEKHLQGFRYLHGGVTIALLETVASYGAVTLSDPSRERAFGVECGIRHIKSCTGGTVRGLAELDRREGNKQFWNVRAVDDVGDVISEGVFVTKIVTLERLREIELERQAKGGQR